MDTPDDFNAISGERHGPTQMTLPTAQGGPFSVLDGLTEPFYTLDSQWCFTFLNAEAEAYFGRARAELLEKCIWEECPRLRGSVYETQARIAVERSIPCVFEQYDAARNRWKELRVIPSSAGLAVFFIDVTESKLRQDAECDNALRFQVVARATTDVIFDWNVAADYTWWSDGLHTVFGYDSPDFARTLQAWADHVHPDEREQVHNSFCEALRSGRGNWTGEYRFRRKDGSYADVYSNTIIARDRNGMAIRAIGAMIDVTEKKHTEAERLRNEARIRLQASLLDKAHDAISVTGVDGGITYWNHGAEFVGWDAIPAMFNHFDVACWDCIPAYLSMRFQNSVCCRLVSAVKSSPRKGRMASATGCSWRSM